MLQYFPFPLSFILVLLSIIIKKYIYFHSGNSGMNVGVEMQSKKAEGITRRWRFSNKRSPLCRYNMLLFHVRTKNVKSRVFTYYIPLPWIRNQVRWGMYDIILLKIKKVKCVFRLFGFQYANFSFFISTFSFVQLEWKNLNSRRSRFPNE